MFSVMVPTRTRAEYLRFALKSLSTQTFQDFEVFVSDNASEDDTAQVAKEFPTLKIHYGRSAQRLSMVDSWSFALEAVLDRGTGEYIGLLADDDAWCPNYLNQLSTVLKDDPSDIVGANFAVHREGSSVIHIQSFSREVRKYNRKDIVADLFGKKPMATTVPFPGYYFFRRDLAMEVIQRTSRLYLGTCPDMVALTLLLSKAKQMTHLHFPSWVVGNTIRSIGHSFMTGSGDAGGEFLSEFQKPADLTRLPNSLPLYTNYLSGDRMMLSETFPDLLPEYTLNLIDHFKGLWNDIQRLDLSFPKNRELSEKYFSSLNSQNQSLREDVEHWIKRRAKRAERLKDPAFVERLSRRSASRPHLQPARDISHPGIKTIVDAARLLETYLNSV